ncbi:MAG: lysophospholipid acyltransferase family protein [Bacteroidetes bacterium]|nr:lysophospholipid acyltransferase family protein [Bacteroidota bacterium]
MKSFLEYKLLPFLINILAGTLRFKSKNVFLPKNAVYIFWHSQMIGGWYLFKNKKAAAIVSQSKDGEILTGILKNWNYKVCRGSSSKGGKEALRDLIEYGKQGYSIVITPDGPRGPANEIKNGALVIANECSIPVIPVKIKYSSKKVLAKSWDKFQVPSPFCKCEVEIGNEFFYEKYLEENELVDFKNKLKKEL